MSRWIKEDTLRTKLIQYIGLTNGFNRAFSEAPSIDIVHCEECKHWKDYECHCESASTDHEGGASYSLDRDANDYCSFGERSEE